MKTKLATILAVVMFVAVGVVSTSQTNAKNSRDVSPAPAPTSNGVMTPAQVAQFDWTRNHGKIKRLYPDPTGVYFQFGGNAGEFQTAMNPTNGYYFIPLSHPNYKALVDLLYLAAEKRWNLNARTQPTLNQGRADVIYLVQDF